MKIIKNLSNYKNKLKTDKIAQGQLLLLLIVSLSLSLFIITPSVAAAASLSPVDIMINVIAKMFQSIANGIYAIGFYFLKISMDVSGTIITNSLDPGTGVHTLDTTIDILAYTTIGVALIITIVARTLNLSLKEWSLSSMIPRLVSTFFLMIMSRPIAGVIYDIASVIVNTIAASSLTNIAALWHDPSAWTKNVSLFGSIISIVIALFAFIVMVLGSLILIARVAMIVLCIILAPLAFACNLLPWTRKIYSTWWSEYAKWVFYLPIMMIMLVIGQGINQMSANSTTQITHAVNEITVIKWGDDLASSVSMINSISIEGLYLELISIVITGAAIIVPFKLVGGKTANAAIGTATKKAKGAMSAYTNSKNNGKSFGERMVNKFDKNGTLKNWSASENPGQRAAAAGMKSVFGISGEEEAKREAAAKQTAERFDLTEMGQRRLNELTGVGATSTSALQQMESELLSGHAADDYYKGMKRESLSDEEKRSELKAKTLRNQTLAHGIGDDSLVVNAAKGLYGADQKIITAKTAAQVYASKRKTDPGSAAEEFISSIKGLKGEHLASTDWSLLNSNDFTPEQCDKIAETLEGTDTYMERSGKVTNNSKAAMEAIRAKSPKTTAAREAAAQAKKEAIEAEAKVKVKAEAKAKEEIEAEAKQNQS